MAPLATSLVRKRHPWTGDDVPWMIDTGDTGAKESAKGRLFGFLSGGGLSAFGRPNSKALVRRRQNRFLVVAGAIGALWLLFSIV